VTGGGLQTSHEHHDPFRCFQRHHDDAYGQGMTTSAHASASETTPETEIWRVQLPTGEVRALSLDALDDAFQSGLITEATPVLAPGATAWTKLADAAGLDAPAPAPEMMAPSVAPIAVNVGPESMPPSLDLASLDLDEPSFKRSKGRTFAIIGAAVLLVGGLGFAATRVGGMAVGASTNALVAPNAAAAAPPPAAESLPEASKGSTLTEEQKARLAEADKAREAREAQKRKDRPAPPVRGGSRPAGKSSQPFTNSGNKYDPLNGAL